MATLGSIIQDKAAVEAMIKQRRKSLIWPTFWVFWSTGGIALAIHNIFWSTTANETASAISLYVNLFVLVFWGCRAINLLKALSTLKWERTSLTSRYLYYPSTPADRETFKALNEKKWRNKPVSALEPIRKKPTITPAIEETPPPTVEEILKNVKGYKERA
jgi:hypothetical protein